MKDTLTFKVLSHNTYRKTNQNLRTCHNGDISFHSHLLSLSFLSTTYIEHFHPILEFLLLELRLKDDPTPVPIVNAGDGAHMHPSQCLLDLYSIYKTQGTLENLNIYLVGDLKYGRTVHSLITAMRHFNPTFHFIAPKELAMPEEYKLYCKEHNIKYVEHEDFNEDVIADADILYMTRVQKERFSDLMEYERVKNVYILKRDMLCKAKENMKIMHPLPRVNEIAYDVDDDPHAYYIQQAQNGLYAREAIFCHCLGISLEDVKNDKTIIE